MTIQELTLSQIARQIPGATAVLYEHQLDFCCGGKQTLRQAAEEKQLDINQLVSRIDALKERNQSEQSWENTTNQELIQHILSRYHDVHRQQLPELIRLAQRVETVHGQSPHCPVGLAAHLTQMKLELEQHMEKEEQILFPILERGHSELAAGPINVMRHEHNDHGNHIAKLDELTNNITLPKGACNTWRALYLGLDTFKSDLMEHIHLENNILFEIH